MQFMQSLMELQTVTGQHLRLQAWSHPLYSVSGQE